MPTPTYFPLANITLSSSASSVTFSSIPATYRDLVVVCNYQMSANGSRTDFRLNGDTGSNYNDVSMGAYASSQGSFARTSQTSSVLFGISGGPINTFANTAILQIMDYSATDKHKTALSRIGNGSGDLQASAHRYASTSAITSVAILDLFGFTFSAGSTFSLYGIQS